MLIFKGIIIGLGKIIPGVSGSMLAISLGIYKRIIDCINNFFKFSKEDVSFLFKIAIGIIISIVFFSKIIIFFLDEYYLITMIFFAGLIVGGIGDIKKSIVNNNALLVILCFTIITTLGLISINNEVIINDNLLKIVYYFFMGIVDAFTTVVPGISGTATLMMLGSYTNLIKSFSTIFNFNYLNTNILILIPFLFGFIVGIFITAHIIKFLFDKYKSSTYSSILGFSLATIVLMVIKSFNAYFTFKDFFIALLFFALGIFITKKINCLFGN